jgi:hypothetical protein
MTAEALALAQPALALREEQVEAVVVLLQVTVLQMVAREATQMAVLRVMSAQALVTQGVIIAGMPAGVVKAAREVF